MPIKIDVNQDELEPFADVNLPAGISTPAEFAQEFIKGLKYDENDNKTIRFGLFQDKGITVTNLGSTRVLIKIPELLGLLYDLHWERPKNFFTSSILLPSMARATLLSTLTEPTTEAVSKFLQKKGDPVSLTTSLPYGYYNTGRDLVTAVNNKIWEAIKGHPSVSAKEFGAFVFNEPTNRCMYKPDHYNITIDLGSIARTLGFPTTVFGRSPQAAMSLVDFTNGIQSMYVYTSIVDSVIVGDVKVPLLGVVPVKRKVQGEREYYEFVNPAYMPTVKHPFKTVEVQICDDMGKIMKDVLCGKTIVCVHIRDTINKQ